MIGRSVLVLAIAAAVAACGTPGPSSPPLSMTVLPPEEPVQPRTAIAGQRSIFLVRVTGGPADEPIELEATTDGAAQIEIAPDDIDETTVAEVAVIPGPVTAEGIITIAITARRGDKGATVSRTLPLWGESDSLEAEAGDRLASFTTWLAAARPELGITPDTVWTPSALQTQMLVVSHYLFLSDDWEAVLEWHVMIAPHDWERLILRRRWVEERPSLAFEIGSVSAADAPREIEPPDAVIR